MALAVVFLGKVLEAEDVRREARVVCEYMIDAFHPRIDYGHIVTNFMLMFPLLEGHPSLGARTANALMDSLDLTSQT